jgi:hypothetical protein
VESPQIIVYSGFEAFDLKNSLLDPGAMFVEVGGLRYTYLGLQRSGENDRREMGFS